MSNQNKIKNNNVKLLPYLETLNEKQLEAVLHEKNPLLILAGAGSGKTRVITVKVAWLIDSQGVPPWSILAVTFTNKAANEMKERIMEMTSRSESAFIRTFHSFCAWLLRVHGHHIGIEGDFSIYDDEDSALLLKSLNPSYSRSDIKSFNRQISRAKDYGLTPTDDLSVISDDPKFPMIYKKYQQRLDTIGNIDFGGLIMKSIELLRDCSEVAEKIHQQFRVIMVDEYQDSNIAQFQLLKYLYSPETYLCVVGDDDQSIYGFRGAEVQNILNFQNLFKDTDIIKLEQNYRSKGNILKSASAVVSNNRSRLGKELWTEDDDGPPIQVFHINDQDEEAALVCKLVKQKNVGGYAILYRTNAQSVHFESAFSRFKIPYRVIGSLRFYERAEIKDAIAFLKLLINPKDETAFIRIINKPARGIGEISQKRIIADAVSDDNDLLEAALRFGKKGKSKAAIGAKEFYQVFKEVLNLIEESSLDAIIKLFFNKSGLIDYYRKQDLTGDTQKVSNLEELVNLAAKYQCGRAGLVEFLEQMELDSGVSVLNQDSDDEDAVILITMHNTKGLEFDHVIVTGMEEGLFPSIRSSVSDEIEEERRICYVAMTRARKSLTMTSCRNRRIWGHNQYFGPSRFLKEIPKEFKTVVSVDMVPGENSNTKWKKGQAVYHDDYGSGVIIKNWYNGSKELVIVRFQTGFTGQFFTQYSNLELIDIN